MSDEEHEPPAYSRPASVPLTQTPAGWYEDPYAGGGFRYWDGVQFTGQTSRTGVGSADVQKHWSTGLTVVVIVAPLIFIGALVFVIRSFVGTTSKSSAPQPTAPTISDRPERPPDAQRYEDARRRYTLWVDPTWVADPMRVPLGLKVWFTASGSANGFNSNVNVGIEELRTPRTLAQYLDLSIANLARRSVAFDLRSRRIITLTSGGFAGRLDFETRTRPGVTLRYVQMVVVNHYRAAIVTLTTRFDRFDAVDPVVEPYLLTFELHGGNQRIGTSTSVLQGV